MSTSRPRRRRAISMILFVLALAVLHWIGLQLMAEAGVIEQLLSAGGAEGLAFVLVAVAFIFLRLFVIMVGPGVLVVSLVVLLWPTKGDKKTKQQRERRTT